VDPSAYALVYGLRRTRGALASWRERPWPVLRAWVGGSLVAALLLLVAIWVISLLPHGRGVVVLARPPFVVGGQVDVLRILMRNGLVLLLHAMACVAGFIAGSSLPIQARYHTGVMRAIHEGSRRFAIVFVVSATCFSLGWQAYSLGGTAARVAATVHVWEVYVAPHLLSAMLGYG
jgi:hypothetical protein